MTGKVIDNSNAVGILVLILPYAVAAVILYTFWQWILLFLVLTLGWKLWQNYQWLKLSARVSPLFNRLIQDNKGCLTAMDLSLKADLSASRAKRFLEKKAEEYGAQKRVLADRGTVYYFLTVSALGAIFDDSESTDEDESTPITDPEPIATKTAAVAEVTTPNPIAETTEIKETTNENKEIHSLIQSELAKRLDSHPATIGRRKTDPDFADWTRSKDPEGIAWKYIPETSIFVAID
jgi:hypothetical protein